jgi:hypothetical protein
MRLVLWVMLMIIAISEVIGEPGKSVGRKRSNKIGTARRRSAKATPTLHRQQKVADVAIQQLQATLKPMRANDIAVTTQFDQITAHEMKDLLSRMSITDGVMNSYLQLMAQPQPGRRGRLSAFIEASVWKYVRDEHRRREPLQEEAVQAFRQLFQSHDRVLLLHHVRAHWLLLVYSRADNKLEVMDSLGRSLLPGDVKAIGSEFASIFGPMLPATDRPLRVSKTNVPQQTELDCGVFTVLNAERVWRGQPVTDYMVDIVKAREHVAKVLVANLYSPFPFDHLLEPPAARSREQRTMKRRGSKQSLV